jgi:hypothetical protein
LRPPAVPLRRDKSLVRIGTAGTLAGREPRRPQFRGAGERPDRAGVASAIHPATIKAVGFSWLSTHNKDLSAVELNNLDWENMCDLAAEALVAIVSWNWLEILKVATGLWTAVVAWLALQNWKRQSIAQRQAAFLDELTDAVHEFIDRLSAPLAVLRFVRVAVASYSGLPQLDQSLKYPEAVAYIEKEGGEDAKALREYLKLCSPTLSKIRSLVAKGQVFGFDGYSECQNSCRLIVWQYERIQAICGIIGRPSLNWRNPEVEKSLGSVLSIDPDEVKRQIDEEYVKFIEFVGRAYAAAYK